MKCKILWPQLGWRAPKSSREPEFDEGPVGFMVVSPWCPDCHTIAARLAESGERAIPKGMPVWLVGEFAPEKEVRAFAREYKLKWPLLFGTPSKDNVSLNEARFRDLRLSAGDTRRWGVPTWIEGEIRNGWLLVERVETFN